MTHSHSLHNIWLCSYTAVKPVLQECYFTKISIRRWCSWPKDKTCSCSYLELGCPTLCLNTIILYCIIISHVRMILRQYHTQVKPFEQPFNWNLFSKISLSNCSENRNYKDYLVYLHWNIKVTFSCNKLIDLNREWVASVVVFLVSSSHRAALRLDIYLSYIN